MRILTLVIFAAAVGAAMGAAVAYVEVGSDAKTIAATTPVDPVSKPPVDFSSNVATVEVDEPNFKFGSMERGKEKSHEFVLRNAGTEPVTLEVGSTTCKCTLGHVTGEPIQPGESTKVRLEWKALSEPGPFRQRATIKVHPGAQELELTIEGDIVLATNVEPPDFVIDKVAVNEIRSATVFVMAMLQDELTVDSAELTDAQSRDKFDIKVEDVPREQLPNPKARDGVKITLTTKPGLPVGRFDQSLTLHTNLKDGEVIHVPVLGRLVGDITVHGTTGWLPEQDVLLLGQVKSSEGRKAHLNIVARGENVGDLKFEVGSVEPAELKAKLGTPQKLKDTLLHVPLEIEVPPGTRPMVRLDTSQGEAAKILIKTTHPEMKELVVYVRFAVER